MLGPAPVLPTVEKTINVKYPSKKQKDFHLQVDASSIGLEMGGCVVVGYLLGSWVDGVWGVGPWGSAFFLVVGFGAAAKAVWRIVKRYQREIAADQAESQISL